MNSSWLIFICNTELDSNAGDMIACATFICSLRIRILLSISISSQSGKFKEFQFSWSVFCHSSSTLCWFFFNKAFLTRRSRCKIVTWTPFVIRFFFIWVPNWCLKLERNCSRIDIEVMQNHKLFSWSHWNRSFSLKKAFRIISNYSCIFIRAFSILQLRIWIFDDHFCSLK